MLLPKVPQGCMHNSSQEQLYAHRTQASPLLHMFQVLDVGYLELSDRAGSPAYVTKKELGCG